MEEKILKASVFVNDTLFNESTEQPIDVDFTLPDYCPDISKIVKCRAVSRISSVQLSRRERSFHSCSLTAPETNTKRSRFPGQASMWSIWLSKANSSKWLNPITSAEAACKVASGITFDAQYFLPLVLNVLQHQTPL